MANRDSSLSGALISDGKALPLLRHPARTLRYNQTEAEQKLWKSHRANRLDGLKFRRQFPIEEFIADFCCTERMLVFELNGDQHAEQVGYDSWRTQIGASRRSGDSLLESGSDVEL
jgi:very-short-patch-repair endonuclease